MSDTRSIRKATEGDLPVILALYAEGRAYMRENGNMTQWADGYPSEALVREDIRAGFSHVVCEGEEIIGVFCYFKGIEPTYLHIYEGAWQNDAPYGVLHRIAVSAHRKGVASLCYEYCFARCGNLKADTHRDNIPMQRSLLKNGFVPCGIIYLENGEERLAYQKAE